MKPCGIFSSISTRNMNPLRLIIFELHLFSCLANQRPYMVTIATRTKQYIDSESSAYELSYGINKCVKKTCKDLGIKH